ncbi:hypothetical protein [Spirosoma panaciterrae]|uniref:hypothetical protein n=1 Tax=Spirosoma panaciterrae TaxID=496058 RepID=UPI000367B42B|nr:hypothetical protein [Spirosoma panaciterrae]
MTNPTLIDTSVEDKIKEELAASVQSKRKRIFSKIFGAALGSIPWVGGFLSAMTDFKSDEGQVKNNELYEQWLSEHTKKMRLLGETLVDVAKRLDDFPEEINERLESEEYLDIVRKSFRSWDNADTFDKRELIRKLLTNAGAHQLVPDDLIRLFLDWINLYHEIHFAVIKVIYQNPGVTRYDIWHELNGTSVRENSLEADLFKLLIRDLSMGSVIRQHIQTDYYGNFMKKPKANHSSASNTMKSAFDDQEQYELTELGKQFVHYTMNEVVRKIGQ